MSSENLTEDNQVEQILKRMDFFYENRKYDHVLEEYGQLMRHVPDHYDGILTAGWAHYYLGQNEEGVQLVKRLVSLYPEDDKVHCLLGLLYRGLYQFEEAIFHGKKAIEINSKMAFHYLDLATTLNIKVQEQYGDSFIFTGLKRPTILEEYKLELETIVEILQTGTKLMPDNATMHGLLGFTYLRLCMFEEAEDAFKTALTLDPRTPKYYVTYSRLQYFLGRKDEAKELVHLALTINPEDSTALEIIQFWEKEDEIDKDGAVYAAQIKSLHRRIVQLYPKSPVHHLRLIKILFYFGENEPRKELKAYLKLNPNDLEMNLSYGKILYDNSEYKEALGHFRRCNTIFPDNEHIQNWIDRISEKGSFVINFLYWGIKPIAKLIIWLIIYPCFVVKNSPAIIQFIYLKVSNFLKGGNDEISLQYTGGK
ncbi:tetratricopeptide repeat protein [Brevibacillus brevis]|uniref:Tetratricopeptide repeat protein n=1 Tax=Brevibacillus brevis TaxID=1393 RepID=A0A2Z4MHW1_BREBE|nr:tetratricopeptide repeat protein [Brevibacillus brevis]AWX56096.1 tetratricopeptide repeat protein [Brevibacillus brevis]